MEQLVDIGEQLIFILMGLASVLALGVGLERAVVFSKFAKSGQNSIKAIIEKLRGKDIKGTFTLDLPVFLQRIIPMDKKR